MSYLLEILSKGLEANVGETLYRHIRADIGVRTSDARCTSNHSCLPEREQTKQVTKLLEELAEVVHEHPDNPDARYQLGLSLLNDMRFPDAEEHLLCACREKPDFLPARLALASAYDEMGQSQKSLEHLRIANQIHPGIPAVLFAIGYCLEKLFQNDEAREFYRDTVAADEDMVSARQRLAAVAMLDDDIDESIEQYEHLHTINPADASTRAALAHLYYRSGRYDQAAREFETAIAMEPDNWALMDDEVELLVTTGQLREAAERLYRLIELQGPFADLHLRLADVLSEMGADNEATNQYLCAIQADPDYLEARIGIGRHHLAHGRWTESAEAFHHAAETNDNLLTCYVGLGVAQAAAGHETQAIETFQLAGAVEPNSTLLLSEMAKLQLKAATAEQFQRGLDSLDESPHTDDDLDHDDLMQLQIERHAQQVAEKPEYADLRYRYGILLRAEGRLGEALEQFTEAVRINPTYVAAIIRRGITQQELGQTDQAVETFKQALELKGEYVDLHYRLALLQTDRRQFSEAVEHMEKAAALAPGNGQVRAALALSLQNMGLMDRVAATWRNLKQMHVASQSN